MEYKTFQYVEKDPNSTSENTETLLMSSTGLGLVIVITILFLAMLDRGTSDQVLLNNEQRSLFGGLGLLLAVLSFWVLSTPKWWVNRTPVTATVTGVQWTIRIVYYDENLNVYKTDLVFGQSKVIDEPNLQEGTYRIFRELKAILTLDESSEVATYKLDEDIWSELTKGSKVVLLKDRIGRINRFAVVK